MVGDVSFEATFAWLGRVTTRSIATRAAEFVAMAVSLALTVVVVAFAPTSVSPVPAVPVLLSGASLPSSPTARRMSGADRGDASRTITALFANQTPMALPRGVGLPAKSRYSSMISGI